MTYLTTLAGHPVERFTSPNRGGQMSGHRGLVLHIAQGFYEGTKNWQMNPDQRYADGTRVNTCSTWIVGKKLGEVAQMVDTDLIAWCQRDGSRTWLSVELVGFAPDRPTVWQVEVCAQLLAWDHQENGTPLQVADHPGERGLGHHSMDREWLGEQWGHEACPGSGVIGAKAAIVARAKEIVGGDDVSWSQQIPTYGWIREAYPELGTAVSADDLQMGAYAHARSSNVKADRLEAGQAAILAQLAGQDVAEAVEALLDAAALQEREQRREELAALRDGLAPALLAELGPALVAELGEAAGSLSAEVVEAAVGRALARTTLSVAPAEPA